MRRVILDRQATRVDSVGGVIECAAYGVPAGVGDPMFDGIENRIARIAFGIPAVKGVDFGAGFAAAYLTGSENNDPYRMVDGVAKPASNNAGGILGGITTGMPVVWQMAVKPTPSIARAQPSVDLDAGRDAELSVRGRHDPCIVPRAVPVAEAACALALLDALLSRRPLPRARTTGSGCSTRDSSPSVRQAGHGTIRNPGANRRDRRRPAPTSSASASTSRARWPRPRRPRAGPSSTRRASARSSTASPRARPSSYRPQAVALFSLLMSHEQGRAAARARRGRPPRAAARRPMRARAPARR